MSLKGFHIVFITISTLLFLALAVWAFGFAERSVDGVVPIGVIGVIGAILLPIYAVYFIRKSKDLTL